MAYLKTIDEDLQLAKEVLARAVDIFRLKIGDEFPQTDLSTKVAELGATILEEDSYIAYKLLESFIDEIERSRKE